MRAARRIYREAFAIDLNLPIDNKLVEEKFDVIIFADVLEHLVLPEQVLRYFRRMLKKDGVVIVSVPNVANWRVRFSLLLGSFNYQEYGVLDRTHLHLYTFRSANEMVKTAGYRPVKSIGTANLPLIGMLTKIPFLKGLASIQIILVATKD